MFDLEIGRDAPPFNQQPARRPEIGEGVLEDSAGWQLYHIRRQDPSRAAFADDHSAAQFLQTGREDFGSRTAPGVNQDRHRPCVRPGLRKDCECATISFRILAVSGPSIRLITKPGRKPARDAVESGATRLIRTWPSTIRRSIPIFPPGRLSEPSSRIASRGIMPKCD